MTMEGRSRWLALYVLCLGDLMIVLDGTIVNVALPTIRADLGFSPSSLAWVVNAYLLTFGGFLLLSGRLGDLLGPKRVFLGGTVFFTIASVACGLAPSAPLLVVGRAVQGLGGAAVSAVALALIIGLFTDPAERAKAMGVFGFVMSGGGAVGVLAGGVLAPGNSVGQLAVTSLALASGSQLAIELGDPAALAYDRVQASGAISLAGSLSVALTPGFAPQAGQTFDLLSGASVAGKFSSVAAPPLPGPLAWNVRYAPTGVSLAVVSADFNRDGRVDGGDLAEWQADFAEGGGSDAGHGAAVATV